MQEDVFNMGTCFLLMISRIMVPANPVNGTFSNVYSTSGSSPLCVTSLTLFIMDVLKHSDMELEQ